MFLKKLVVFSKSDNPIKIMVIIACF